MAPPPSAPLRLSHHMTIYYSKKEASTGAVRARVPGPSGVRRPRPLEPGPGSVLTRAIGSAAGWCGMVSQRASGYLSQRGRCVTVWWGWTMRRAGSGTRTGATRTGARSDAQQNVGLTLHTADAVGFLVRRLLYRDPEVPMSDTISPSVTFRVPCSRDAIRRPGGPEGTITVDSMPGTGTHACPPCRRTRLISHD